MVQNPPEGYQRIIPYLLYDDAGAVLNFLVKALGFEERMRMPGPDGKIMHAEAAYGDNVVMLATAPDANYASPKNLPGRHALVCVYVDDVDGHHAHAKSAGAEIVQEPTDQFYGDRSYRVKDPEGLEWTLAMHVKDFDPSEMPTG